MTSAPVFSATTICLSDLGPELVYLQNNQGQYLSFYWKYAEEYGFNPEDVVRNAESPTFAPVEMSQYREHIQRVMERRIPETYHCLFQYGDYTVPMELVITPVVSSGEVVSSVLVMGHCLDEKVISKTSYTALTPEPDSYQNLAQQIMRNIRRHPYQNLLSELLRNIRKTLDLDIIWRQTVDGLGETLEVSRCLIISYDMENKVFRVEAEYCQKPYKSMLGERLYLENEPYLQQALQSSDPVALDQLALETYEQKSVLIASTFYQNQRNALICLQQCDRHRYWGEAEIELLREFAAQVGTAIAHATLYKELEIASKKAEEASRLKSDFLASTSHELRTPLNGIIGFLRLILDGMADDPLEQREFLEEAHKSALHLLNLINDILDVAKIEAGKLDLELSDFRLGLLFENVENFTRTQAQQKKLSYEIQTPSTRDPIMVYGNYQRLLQVMLNLVGNAIKFTHEGGITISADILKKPLTFNGQKFPGSVRIRVADTGIGVALEEQPRLFQKFSTVDGGRTKKYGGTGLGLAISQKLIEAMGGTINFFSMGEDLGSTVTFTVPLFQMPIMKVSQD
ncbi:ATP-binding protein [Spirulina subsalsa]|uniref:ATP-binding protein n=1 Tax=Spirulina subsalsa TaxID=54311 RepID=UPI00036CC9FB|nr:ATP-binding protein [Spirulina subsalsa]